jgi:ABC-type multidrug transport system ATPase subunit
LNNPQLPTPRPISAVRIDGLVKRYDEVEAVRGIEFAVRSGEVFGFLGPNGAGKSTTINMLCTLVRPSAGRATVAGHDVVSERDASVLDRLRCHPQQRVLAIGLAR